MLSCGFCTKTVSAQCCSNPGDFPEMMSREELDRKLDEILLESVMEPDELPAPGVSAMTYAEL